MDVGWIDVFDVCGFGPAANRLCEVGTQHNFVLIDLEVSMNQMESEFGLSVVAGEKTNEVVEVMLGNFGLVLVISKLIITVQLIGKDFKCRSRALHI